MKISKIMVGLGVCALIALSSCRKNQEIHSVYAYSSFETTCMGVERDGTQTVRAWGKGSNKSDAIEQAKKNAVYDILFTGIKGSGECAARPLVTEVNARQRYASYFDPFFRDGGEYRKFVKEEKSGESSRVQAKGTSQENWGAVVTVDRPALKRQLIADGILREDNKN